MKKELKYKNWMVTIMSDKDGHLKLPEIDDVILVFDEIADKWVFQQEYHTEVGELQEKKHYQCCLITKIRTRKSTILNNLADFLEHPKERIRVDRMAGTWEQAMLYCSKKDTAASETYTSNSLKLTYKYSDIAFLNEEERRFPWQKEILDLLFTKPPTSLKTPDDRTIFWVTDLEGCTGKSKLVKYLCTYNNSITKLSFGTSNQLRAASVSAGIKSLYIIDIPRTLGTDDSMNDILTVLEDLKNGFIVSSFYGSYSKLVMDPPHILVFSNMRCPVEKLSKDRWKCYIIINKELKYARENSDYYAAGYSLTEEGEKRA